MRSAIVQLAGVLMLLSALAHGLMGWPAMAAELAQTAASPDLVAGLGAGWLWGSVAMAVFGTITLGAGARLRHGNRSGIPALLAIGLGYVAFGGWAFAARDFEPFFLLFVLTGIMAAGPVVGAHAGHSK
ncbi:MAG TPA: hypothetical protein VLL51_08575 [Gemmatimonadales bacterium]|nr:hypothetical protein [Gemmatimonadales bacterium]